MHQKVRVLGGRFNVGVYFLLQLAPCFRLVRVGDYCMAAFFLRFPYFLTKLDTNERFAQLMKNFLCIYFQTREELELR
jgi:hypothetical protein